MRTFSAIGAKSQRERRIMGPMGGDDMAQSFKELRLCTVFKEYRYPKSLSGLTWHRFPP
ncbi:unnamed protein product [Dovyalis caffra]|uniref:Uncharacterized protein n=1 Tax=Dovyalis caffra TaxID=77055 RepID=A0AAV1S4T2_9ROSI|nr:unnamed protein product [Dovyalis caffra]